MKSIKYHSAVLMIKDIYLMIHNIQSYEYGHYKINHWFIRQRAFIEIWSTREVWRARNIRSREQLSLLECSLNFPSASYLNERIADVGTNCFITFSTRRKIFSRGICSVTSWACTIGIWSTLAHLNLIRQIYKLCYNMTLNTSPVLSALLLGN